MWFVKTAVLLAVVVGVIYGDVVHLVPWLFAHLPEPEQASWVFWAKAGIVLGVASLTVVLISFVLGAVHFLRFLGSFTDEY